MTRPKDPIDPASREAVTRDIARVVLTAESRSQFNPTETMIWMHLGDNPEGLSISSMSDIMGKARKTIKDRLTLMRKDGLVERVGNIWKLSDYGFMKRRDRASAAWTQYPKFYRDIVDREVERRGGNPQ